MDNYIQNTNVKILDSSLSGDSDGEITVDDMDAVMGTGESQKQQVPRVERALSGVF